MHKHQIDSEGRWMYLAEYTAPSAGDWDNPFVLRVDQQVRPCKIHVVQDSCFFLKEPEISSPAQAGAAGMPPQRLCA